MPVLRLEQSTLVPIRNRNSRTWSPGTVTLDTLVWRDGMQNWLPFVQVVALRPAPGALRPGPMAGASDKPMVVCSSCHRAFRTTAINTGCVRVRGVQARVCAAVARKARRWPGNALCDFDRFARCSWTE